MEDEDSTEDEKDSENEDADRNRNRNRNRNIKKKGPKKGTRKGQGKSKGSGGGATKPVRSGKGTVRSFRTMVDSAEWDYDPDHVPEPPTKKRSSYHPMNEDCESVGSDTEVCIRVYVHHPFPFFLGVCLFLLTVNNNEHSLHLCWPSTKMSIHSIFIDRQQN